MTRARTLSAGAALALTDCSLCAASAGAAPAAIAVILKI